MNRRNATGLSSEAGAALVEFALVTPVVLLLLFGTLDFARAFNAYVTVSNASREGAHYAILHPSATSAEIFAAVASRGGALDRTKLTVHEFYGDGTTFTAWPPGGVPASSPNAAPLEIRVVVGYEWSAATSLVGGFFSAGTGSPTFESSSTMETMR